MAYPQPFALGSAARRMSAPSRAPGAYEMTPIATIHTDFAQKFGVPRQSGLSDSLHATVVFAPPYRSAECVRGLEGYSHLWLIWVFSEHAGQGWSPTVRPPKLGGNARMGVVATRAPYRPIPIGLSCVRLESVEHTAEGPVLHVLGADLMDGTPILDIKPYLSFADSHPDALGGFSPGKDGARLRVDVSDALLDRLPPDKHQALLDVLAQDPRPGYQHDPARIYGLAFAGFDVRFCVEGGVARVVMLERG